MTVHEIVLVIHSYLRWLVLALLLLASARSFRRWQTRADWDGTDERLHAAAIGSVDLQFTLGLLLYAVLSPLPGAFFADVARGMKVGPLRFFGMEHALGMLIATAIVHVGRSRSKRTLDSGLRHRRVWVSTLIGVLVIAASIPWPGRSSARPLLRGVGGPAGPAPTTSAAAASVCPPVYESRCAACHGHTGRGDGPSAASLNPPPRDLASPSFQSYASDEALRKVIVGGGNAVGLGPMMPAHPDLSAAELDALVRCIRSLGRAHTR
jgi:mono/diheme cytochrome c family protein